LLGHDVPVLPAADGTLRAEVDGKPLSAKSAQTHIARALCDRMLELRAAMEALSAAQPPEELNGVSIRLYKRFRPDVPDGAQDWGAKSELRLECILSTMG
jgi:hypothetical protein